ncbi:MAG: hypothetical protein K2K45_01080 [Muribaculaceae bacterium]|nr:hypothetical protein [Muribaculaceae bacterium]
MKKLLLTFGAAAMCLSSFGFTRVLYQQNFEGVTTIEEAGWSYGAEGSIGSDADGKFLDLYVNANNGRSGQCVWGQEIYLDNQGNPVIEDGTYTVSFEICYATFSNNQYNGCLDIFTNHTPGVANQAYRMPWTSAGNGGVWENFLLDMTQDEANKSPNTFFVNAPTQKSVTVNEETNEETVSYSIPAENAFEMKAGDWYSVTLTVNVDDHTVDYSIENLSDDSNSISGTREVPEINPDGSEVNMFAEGMYVLTARYQTRIYIDNILITCESEKAVAAPPTVALSKIGWTGTEDEKVEDLEVRGYKISYGMEETLHFIGTDNQEQTYDWADNDGILEYETKVSGKIIAWTTCEDAKSDIVEMDVDCTPIVLPAAAANITSVSDGFVKTYVLTVDNADVPLRPTIVMDYTYVGEQGENSDGQNLYSGDKVSVEQKGSMKVTTKAFGYKSAETTIDNNLEFAAKKVYDFARLTDAQLTEAGFDLNWTITNSSATSGFNNWTARKRMYYYDSTTGREVETDGKVETVYDTVYPFGFISEDNETNVIQSTLITDNSDNTKYFEGLAIFDNARNVGIIHHIGLYNDETANNYNDVTIKDVESSDFVVVNTINSYGSNSCHPIVASVEEYYAAMAGDDAVLNAADLLQLDPTSLPNLKKEGTSYSLLNEETGKYDIHYGLYRIDTALTKLTIYSQIGGPIEDAVEGIEAEAAGDNNWYTIAGVRVAEPTQPGLYIHNGKKYIVK